MASIQVVGPIDFSQNELQNARLQNLNSAPPAASGLIYYNSTTGLVGVSTGSEWIYLGEAGESIVDAEQVQDIIGSMLGNSSIVTSTYNDANGTLVLSIGAGQIVDSMVSNTAAISADKLTEGATNKLLTAAERTKLTAVASGATANQTDAYLTNRANHTGTQTTATISDFTSAVNAVVAQTVGAAPDLLNTLDELAAALGDDPNFAATITAAIAQKADTTSLAPIATSGSYADLTGKPEYVTTVGDGTATTIVVTHSLGKNVIPALRLTAAPGTFVLAPMQATSDTTITLTFGQAPAAGQYTLLLHKVG
jgi:hypothetical protein